MASVARRPNGTREIQFVDRDGKRRAVRLGKVTERALAQIHGHLEHLIDASIQGTAPPQATSAWVAELGDALHDRLVRVGLVAEREKVDAKTLGEFLDWYIEDRGKTRKAATLITWGNARRLLVDFFGEDCHLCDISEGDVESFWEHLHTVPAKIGGNEPLASNTIRRRCGIAKQFFAAAVRKRWIEANPFDVLESLNVRANRARDHFVSREDAEKILAACPDQQWRMIFALSRFGGLRCPSETLALKWADVLWDQNKIRVPSPKTAHHEGKAERMIPLFPELRRELSDG